VRARKGPGPIYTRRVGPRDERTLMPINVNPGGIKVNFVPGQIATAICLELDDGKMLVILVPGTFITTIPPMCLVASIRFSVTTSFQIETIGIDEAQRIVTNISVLIKCLRVGVMAADGVGACKPSLCRGEVSRAEVIEAN
jgi:hypothetical protein